MIPFILFYELLELWKSVVDLINNNFLGFRKYSSKPEVSDHVSLLAPTGALVLMMVYYLISAHFFRFSLSPLMQLMLQVSL